jgi:hypothetical protein
LLYAQVENVFFEVSPTGGASASFFSPDTNKNRFD